jgi:hypothetical protein
LARDHGKVIQEVVKAPDILLPRRSSFSRFGVWYMFLIGNPALPYARNKDRRNDLDFFPSTYERFRDVVEEPLSRLKDVWVENNIVKELGLCKRFKAWIW